MKSISNAQRVFDSVLSVDAWHTRFSDESRIAAVHVDVSFLRGKLGDEPKSPVRFEIALKRAEVVFIIPSSEPLSVVQTSVRRSSPIFTKERKSISSTSEIKLKGGASFDLTKLSANVSAGAAGSLAQQTSHSTEQERMIGGINWDQRKDTSGNYRWEFTPSLAYPLLGKAWDAVTEPLLKIKKLTSASAIEAMSRVEIWCRREDIQITNIQVKEKGMWERIIALKGGENKLAAAEAYIRNALSSKDLDIHNFDDPFGSVKIADIIVEPLVEE